jgi:hypothetical protein
MRAEVSMRFLILLLPLLLLMSCASQDRRTYANGHDPWADYQPSPRETYDRTYIPPHQRSADERYEQARMYEDEGRDDQARIEYHAVFLRDRWHKQGNRGYQDLMLRNNLQTSLWQEYLDLWEANRERGDALWFHLRTLVLERQGQGPQERRRRAPTDDERLRVHELMQTAEQHARAGEDAQAYEAVTAALEIADMPELHRARITLASDEQVSGLVSEYAERFDDDPSDGDMLAAYALATARTDPVEALKLLRDGYVLALPGYWLPFTLAEIAWDMAVELDDQAGDEITTDEERQLVGWLLLAESMWESCLQTRPDDETARESLDAVRAWLTD